MTTVCLTFDFDAVSLWITTMRQPSATPLSRGEYGARVGVPRLLALLAEKRVTATFFIPAHTVRAFPDAARAIRDAGHEIALHGFAHENPVGLAPGEEARLLDLSIASFRDLGVTPQGYRSPAWDLTVDSISLLAERGLIYDSSMMADDYRPYLARRGTTASETSYDPGEETRVVELPVAWELDDFPHFTFLNKPMYLGLRSPDEVLYLWREEFDFCHDIGGTFTLTMHPQIIGRGPRIAMLGRLIDHMAAQGAAFRTCAEEALRQRTLLTTRI
ncbi:polysaccharide deacetylase family protein [Albidovulum sp.]|uniref:polysaccharide deacetylase family protein n=1 Tax=Albidovulum sp. TaxID=1872424 RepID=UPI0039B821F9